MKTSKYNFLYNHERNHIAYNSFTNVLAILSDDEYNYLTNISKGSLKDIEKTIVEDLKNGGFIIDDDFQEVDVIRERMLAARYNNSVMGLTLAPTMDCNFCCSYCYEKGCDRSEKMSLETQNAIISFVKAQAVNLKKLDVTWYGGEPLLAIEIIENLTARLKSICKRNKILYSAGLVSNGYLLDMSMVTRLKECDVSFCQITIDGDEKEHNQRRIHISGKDTYKTIIDNVIAASEIIPISVRVNTDKNNKEAIYKVNNTLDKKYKNISVYPAPIRFDNECYAQESCFRNEEFLKYEMQYFQESDEETIFKKYPQIQANACCADANNSFVISPSGDMFKCWSDIGRKQYCIGNIRTGIDNIVNAIRYSRMDPLNDTKCMKCKFLPICLGGCPREYVRKSDYRCNYSKKIFKNYIVKLVNTIILSENQ